MADVTDAAFRRIIAKYSKWGGEEIFGNDGKFTRPLAVPAGGPDVMWTEFVSADGLCSPGRSVLLRDLAFTDAERPIVAQIFGSRPENIEKAAALARELGFDGVDINMGCPDKSIEKQGAGAAMIKDPARALEVIHAAKAGAKELPVSVKTRVGYNKVELDTWLPTLLGAKPAAITIHARTRKEMSKVPARWEHVREAVAMARGTGVLIIGNGDVRDLSDAHAKAAETGADGIMLGKAIFGRPELFSKNTLPLRERLHVMMEHTKLFHELLGDIKNFAIMKKHYKAYVNGFDGAKELRIMLMETDTPEEVESIVRDFLARRPDAL